MKTLYDAKTVNDFINRELLPIGFEVYVIPGALIDTLICYSPNDRYYNYIFREEYLNEWSSAYSLRRCRNVPEWAEKAIALEYYSDAETA